MTSERVSPILATWENNCSLPDQLDARLVAALDAEGEDAAGALRAIALRQLVVAVARQAGVGDPADAWDGAARCSATASALSQWRCMRSDSVSMPVRMRKALNGEIAGPRSRRPSTRQAIGEAEIAEGLGERHAVIFGPRRRQHRIARVAHPFERAAVDDHAAHRIAVAARDISSRSGR